MNQEILDRADQGLAIDDLIESHALMEDRHARS
jgi:hypothetical protein